MFNLSSWANEGKSLVDWLINELLEKYQVPKSLSEHWITQQQLILLLDGLDEVLEDYRNDCVRALNKFIGDYPQTEIAVCSRVKDYEALTERLQLSSALCLQPLSPEQIHQFLESVGGSLAGLKVLLKNDAELEQLAQTPLIANFMSVAYQGWSAEELIPQLRTPADRHQRLFDTYIDRRLEQGAASKYSKDNVLRWLSSLASRMVREKQTIFLIEKMQPTWLNNGREERAYRIRAFLIGGLSFGLIGWLIAWLIAWVIDKQINGPIYGLLCGLFCGLFFGPIGGLITGLPIKISPLEKPSWSWQRAKSRFVREFSTGVYYGLIAGLSGGLTGLSLKLIQSGGKLGELVATLSSALSGALILGLILGLIFGLGSGLDSSEIVQRTVPNQGIRTSLRNCVFIGLIVGLSLGLSFGLIGKWILGLSFGLSFGLISALKYGGAACIQHFTLRWTLHQKNRIPQNYAKFLDFISGRRLMKRVGGGYVFFHRMLLEHFARMNPN
ncbi:hypothetical protein QUA30_28015 [Microcoleus sp. Pol14C2]|uniref:hypothetical protein n=1 Tax=unclassified Microcoleus TaxID=2642155 RepID=UPI002FD40A8B